MLSGKGFAKIILNRVCLQTGQMIGGSLKPVNAFCITDRGVVVTEHIVAAGNVRAQIDTASGDLNCLREMIVFQKKTRPLIEGTD